MVVELILFVDLDRRLFSGESAVQTVALQIHPLGPRLSESSQSKMRLIYGPYAEIDFQLGNANASMRTSMTKNLSTRNHS